MKQFQIGWYFVPEDKEYTDNGYECAAWFQRILVKAGKYPVMASKFVYHEAEKKHTNELDNLTISIMLTGVITADDFAGRFCGQLIGTPKFNKNVGKEGSMLLSPYSHNVAMGILNGVSNIELFPEYEAQEIHFISFIDNKPYKTYGIFKVA